MSTGDPAPDRGFHLAQVNVGRLVAPLESPALADFVAGLDTINALADGSPGFVWRLATEAGDATSLRVFDDDTILINMSVWETLESLRDFVYRSGHVDYVRRRKEWFERFERPYLVLWWTPAVAAPSVGEARRRLDLLERLGPTLDAFTFREPFGPPGAPARGRPAIDAEFCWPPVVMRGARGAR